MDSFENKECLNGIKIEKEELLDNKEIVTIKVYEDTINYLIENLKSEEYFMYFKNEKDILVIYKNKTFNIELNDEIKLNEAIGYGIKIGIDKEKIKKIINLGD